MALLLMGTTPLLSTAQTARQVLDRAAAVVTAKQGAKASFTIKGTQLNTTGTIAIKGRKFQATTPQATVWFDGKTQWTYVNKNDEVNITTPSAQQVNAINPYTFIYIYKDGYASSLVSGKANYEVHLTTTKQKAISEMYLLIDKKSYAPKQIRMKQKNGWTTIDISNFKQTALADGIFRFNTKDFPTAEVIDLR